MEEPLADCLARMDGHYRPSSVIVRDEMVAPLRSFDFEAQFDGFANPQRHLVQ